MFGMKKEKKPNFTKASTPEGIRKQRAAIKDYYIKKRASANQSKLSIRKKQEK